MFNGIVKLELLKENDRDDFILDNQRAFKYGAIEEFGIRDEHYEEDGEIISKKTIENSLNSGTAYRIIVNDKKVGGLVVKIEETVGELELLFVNPEDHSKGIGQTAWFLIEKMYPEVKRWETMTPYFEKRNIHFYVNKCGFRIEKFYCEFYFEPKNDEDTQKIVDSDIGFLDELFRFVKEIKR